MLIYANNFTVIGGKPGADASAADMTYSPASTAVFRSVAGWLSKKTRRYFSISDLKAGKDFSGAGYHIQTFAADKEAPAVYSILSTEHDRQVSGRIWKTEISIREEVAGPVFISVLLETDEISTQVREIPESTRPQLINFLAQNAEFAPSTVGLTLLNAANENDFKFVGMEIDRGDRTYPLVLMSAESGEYMVDPERLREQLFGLARVIRIAEKADTWGLANIIGRHYAAWNGSLRIIWPVAPEKDYCYTRLLQEEELREFDRPERAVLACITHRTNLAKKREHFSSADVRAKRQKDYLSQLRKMPDFINKNAEQKIDFYKELSEELEQSLDAKEKEWGELKNQCFNLEYSIENVKDEIEVKNHEISSLKYNLEKAGADNAPSEQGYNDITAAIMVLTGQKKLTPALCLQLAARETGNIIILDSALKSAERASDYQNSDNLLAALCKLGDEFLSAFLEGGDNKAKLVFGTDIYAPKESEQTMNNPKCRRQRTFTYKGREIIMWRHLGWGVANNTREGLRLYFWIDKEDEKIIIGHCGKHLDTVKTTSV